QRCLERCRRSEFPCHFVTCLATSCGSCPEVIQNAQEALRTWALLGRFKELAPPNESTRECVGDCLLKLLFGHAARGNVEKCTQRDGHAKPRAFLDVLRSKTCLVEDAPCGWLLPKLRWDGQMDFAGK